MLQERQQTQFNKAYSLKLTLILHNFNINDAESEIKECKCRNSSSFAQYGANHSRINSSNNGQWTESNHSDLAILAIYEINMVNPVLVNDDLHKYN